MPATVSQVRMEKILRQYFRYTYPPQRWADSPQGRILATEFASPKAFELYYLVDSLDEARRESYHLLPPYERDPGLTIDPGKFLPPLYKKFLTATKKLENTVSEPASS